MKEEKKKDFKPIQTIFGEINEENREQVLERLQELLLFLQRSW